MNWEKKLLKFTDEQELVFIELLDRLNEFPLSWDVDDSFEEIRNHIMQYAFGFLIKKDLPFSTTFFKLEDYARKRYEEVKSYGKV